MTYASQPTRPIVMGTRGMVAAGHPLAAQAGIRVLQDGGNAADAAVTAAAVLAVVQPDTNGAGGDAFAMSFDAATGVATSLNGSGSAPAEMTLDVLRAARTQSPDGEGDGEIAGPTGKGPHAASVPGAVQAWSDLLERAGTMTLADALAPAIRYAEGGFPVSVRLASSMRKQADLLLSCPAAAAAYLRNGRPYQPAELLVLPDLARSLRAIAADGAGAFYRGDLGRRIVAAHRADGGLFSEDDFARHASDIGAPLATGYRGYTVLDQRPVSLGLAFLEELRIVEGFDLASLPVESAERAHLLIEAKKLAFADLEAHLGDPAVRSVPTDALLSDAYIRDRRTQIDPAHASDGYGAGDPAAYGDHTTYLAVVDERGNAVSWIQSNFHSFGSGWMAPGTGILLNDRMAGFSVDPASVNRVAGGKRTAHTLNAPMVLRDGRVELVFGTPGGYGQVQSNLQMLTAYLDHGVDVQEMIEAPRWQSLAGRSVTIESRFPAVTLAGLEARGHELDVKGAWSSLLGGAQAIRVNRASGVLEGGADPRREGYAIGW